MYIYIYNIHIYIYIHRYIYICICTPMYILHIYISATALCAFGVTGLSNVLSDYCYPVAYLVFSLIGPTPDPHG